MVAGATMIYSLMAYSKDSSQPGTDGKWLWPTRAFGALSLTGFLGFCLLNGHRLEEERGRHGNAESSAHPGLRPGQALPSFKIATTWGRALDSTARDEKWLLLVFSKSGCSACSSELRVLEKVKRGLNGRLQIVPVLSERPLLGSVSDAALQYAQQNGLKFEVGLDPNGQVVKQCSGARTAVPLCVLADPQGKVRLIDVRHTPTANGSSRMADALMAFFAGKARPSVSLTRWPLLKPNKSALVPLTLQVGAKSAKTNLLSLSQDHVVIATFLTDRGPLSARRIAALQRLAGVRGVRFLYVLSQPELKSFISQQPEEGGEVMVAQWNTTAVFRAFGEYKVTRGPVTMIAYRGRIVAAESGAQESGEVMESVAAYSCFLSTAQALPIGFDVRLGSSTNRSLARTANTTKLKQEKIR